MKENVMSGLQSKVVVITGASSGIGEATALLLSSQLGSSFVYADRSTLENARRYDSGLVPTTVPKCSRITAADRNQHLPRKC